MKLARVHGGLEEPSLTMRIPYLERMIHSGLIKDNTRKKIKTNLHKCTNALTVTVSEEEGVKLIDKSGKHGQSKLDTCIRIYIRKSP